MRKGVTIPVALIAMISLVLIVISPANATSVPNAFKKFARSSMLAKSGILVIDPVTQTEIFSSGADIPRAPASVLKLVSSVTALSAFGEEKRFKTSINATSEADTFLLLGEHDPWLTTSSASAKKFNRGFSPKLISVMNQASQGARAVRIKYHGLFEKDIKNLRAFYGKKYKFKWISQSQVNKLSGVSQLAGIRSPLLSEIIGFTLLWSDNTLADRLARISAKEMGFPRGSRGMNQAFVQTLSGLGVGSTGLRVKDGSGLSHGNRVSVRTVAELLWKIRIEPQFQAIYDGLPVAGKSGTLVNRFKKSGKSAAKLVRAKTGWINTSVSLAGYVEVENNEYIFAVIANHIKPTESSRELARQTIDKMLATVARPA
jgi:serine-type D-Ala-D-Ala carboxypeptidase/endopeptidase (penicillin-binding protein 4)